ncbi:MAG TPA: tripeptide aminopeptidase PepT, partial [Thermomicrobiales bacterium]|nr:tripeptide aminopeptidase PepT [Thermomicrobiales bacterium]
MSSTPSPFAAELEERLVRYVQIDTTSDQTSPTSPSTEIQYDLLNLLVEELNGIGASDVVLTPYGAITATIPATVKGDIPTIAFLAHVDTAAGFSGTGIKPVIRRDYDGGTITFPDDPELVLSPDVSPYLASKIGEDIVTASGTTILGADDKAGVAIVMAMARHLLGNRDILHGPIRIGFTPDEEIGRGVHADLPDDLGASVAYTFDGAEAGEVCYETFSADKAV